MVIGITRMKAKTLIRLTRVQDKTASAAPIYNPSSGK